MPRGSYRFATPEAEADVWPYIERDGSNVWKWNVFNTTSRWFDGGGTEKTFDEACEAALAVMKI
jgi:hypothetical protein